MPWRRITWTVRRTGEVASLSIRQDIGGRCLLLGGASRKSGHGREEQARPEISLRLKLKNPE